MKISNAKGFTLLEVAIAVVILSIAAVTLIQFSVSGRQMTVSELELSTAANLAKQTLENLKESVRQDQWGLASSPLAVGTGAGAAADINLSGNTYRRFYTVAAVNVTGDGGGQDYRKVRINVDADA